MLSFSSSVWFKRNRCWRRRPGQDGGGEAGAGNESDGEHKQKSNQSPFGVQNYKLLSVIHFSLNSNKLVIVAVCTGLSNVKVQFDF